MPGLAASSPVRSGVPAAVLAAAPKDRLPAGRGRGASRSRRLSLGEPNCLVHLWPGISPHLVGGLQLRFEATGCIITGRVLTVRREVEHMLGSPSCQYPRDVSGMQEFVDQEIAQWGMVAIDEARCANTTYSVEAWDGRSLVGRGEIEADGRFTLRCDRALPPGCQIRLSISQSSTQRDISRKAGIVRSFGHLGDIYVAIPHYDLNEA